MLLCRQLRVVLLDLRAEVDKLRPGGYTTSYLVSFLKKTKLFTSTLI